MNRETLNIPGILASDQPMAHSDFYKWLNKSVARHNDFFVAMDMYLNEVAAFDIKRHKIDPDDLQSLEYVFSYYSAMYTPIRNATRLRALLRPSDDDDAFRCGGVDYRVKPTGILRHILRDLGLVYEVTPQTYYFEIINGFLFIKYQSLIGSRRIAKLTAEQNPGE